MKYGEFIYVKVRKILPLWGKWKHCPKVVVSDVFPFDTEELFYNDKLPNTRIIGAGKVEKAIEICETLGKCCQSGFLVFFHNGSWNLYDTQGHCVEGERSIKKAYYLLKKEYDEGR